MPCRLTGRQSRDRRLLLGERRVPARGLVPGECQEGVDRDEQVGDRGVAPGPDALFDDLRDGGEQANASDRVFEVIDVLVTGAYYLLGRGCFLRSCCSRSSCAIPCHVPVPTRRCGSHREGYGRLSTAFGGAVAMMMSAGAAPGVTAACHGEGGQVRTPGCAPCRQGLWRAEHPR